MEKLLDLFDGDRAVVPEILTTAIEIEAYAAQQKAVYGIL
jgi:hypothetical protein